MPTRNFEIAVSCFPLTREDVDLRPCDNSGDIPGVELVGSRVVDHLVEPVACLLESSSRKRDAPAIVQRPGREFAQARFDTTSGGLLEEDNTAFMAKQRSGGCRGCRGINLDTERTQRPCVRAGFISLLYSCIPRALAQLNPRGNAKCQGKLLTRCFTGQGIDSQSGFFARCPEVVLAGFEEGQPSTGARFCARIRRQPQAHFREIACSIESVDQAVLVSRLEQCRRQVLASHRLAVMKGIVIVKGRLAMGASSSGIGGRLERIAQGFLGIAGTDAVVRASGDIRGVATRFLQEGQQGTVEASAHRCRYRSGQTLPYQVVPTRHPIMRNLNKPSLQSEV